MVKFVREVCYGNFIPLIEKKEIRFAFDAQPERIEAFFDADKLDKIVFNLLSNAIEYTYSVGSVLVMMRLYGEDEGSTFIVEIPVGRERYRLPSD